VSPNPIYSHLPAIIDAARKQLNGRRGHPLHSLIKQKALMANWDIASRYADDGTITKAQYDQWVVDARRTMRASNLKQV
jgi:hypothetical protein